METPGPFDAVLGDPDVLRVVVGLVRHAHTHPDVLRLLPPYEPDPIRWVRALMRVAMDGELGVDLTAVHRFTVTRLYAHLSDDVTPPPSRRSRRPVSRWSDRD